MAETRPEWNSNEEKLLCHMVLDDSYASKVCPVASKAFWRAFIVQNRATGQISAKMRWNYTTKGRSWVVIKPGPETKVPLNHLRRNLENVICTALERIGHIDQSEAAQAIKSFYPPDDGGDGMKTIQWLIDQDLIEIAETPGGEQ